MTVGTRETLLDAALALLDAGGIDAVTLRDVGSRAGVSHNAPYKHFANKEALLSAVAARELRRRQEELVAAMARRESPERALRRALRGYASLAIDYPARFRLIYGKWTAPSDEILEAARASYGQLLATVQAAQAAGALPQGEPERLTALMRALAHGAADLAATGHLSPTGKGRSNVDGLIDDLLSYLSQAATLATPSTPKDTRK